ncbi:MAG: ROK family protein [Actinomycetota bacterium]
MQPAPNPDLLGAPPRTPRTLAIDIGGTGLKASVLDPLGTMSAPRVKVDTRYPCPPELMVRMLEKLVAPLPAYDRISVGFPGMVRQGKILSAPHFTRPGGARTPVAPELVAAWASFDLARALEESLGKPVRVANDADVQGAAVIKGIGLELVITLGTGFGTALFAHGQPAPHMEIAQHPFRKGETYNEQLGEVARQRIGDKKWSKRVRRAVATLDALLFFDHLYVGGGNAQRLKVDLGPKATVIDNLAGIIGGVKLWDWAAPTA